MTGQDTEAARRQAVARLAAHTALLEAAMAAREIRDPGSAAQSWAEWLEVRAEAVGREVVPIWRTGRRVGRTIYLQRGPEPCDDDQLIGVMDSQGDAHFVVETVNAALNATPIPGSELEQRVRALCDDNDRPNDVDVRVPGFVRVDDLRRALYSDTDPVHWDPEYRD